MSLRNGASVYCTHKATRFKVGDLVSCDWEHRGRVTVHRITGKRSGVRNSQTGTLFQVTPGLRGSHGHWIDAAWFFVDGLEI